MVFGMGNQAAYGMLLTEYRGFASTDFGAFIALFTVRNLGIEALMKTDSPANRFIGSLRAGQAGLSPCRYDMLFKAELSGLSAQTLLMPLGYK
ncbi:hypothetical protein [Candidatus Methylobacter oryzae]|uniref:Uncharacterized protein n=1 Tax=Candidatus Methylobacter oryzae TaxID=2497749 RepID=A0ABY3C4J5_9GAMM|nr:hypothetical protein [Candidatus Methylobacter oryzae]TRW89607.1 hypothetical protein EKO24_021340 [Candidatus Methylobacter oryzae]